MDTPIRKQVLSNAIRENLPNIREATDLSTLLLADDITTPDDDDDDELDLPLILGLSLLGALLLMVGIAVGC